MADGIAPLTTTDLPSISWLSGMPRPFAMAAWAFDGTDSLSLQLCHSEEARAAVRTVAWRMSHGAWEDRTGAWEDRTGAWRMSHGAWEDSTGAWEDRTGAWRMALVAWRMALRATFRATVRRRSKFASPKNNYFCRE